MAATPSQPPPYQTACWVCQSTRVALWKKRNLTGVLQPEHLRITDPSYGQTLALWRCQDCGFVFADPADVRGLAELYESLDDRGYEESQEPRALQMRWLLRKALKERRHARTLLDVGAASGLLVAEAQRMGLEATGIEPSRALVDAARRVNGVDLIQGVLPHAALRGRTFDLVCLVDVIEHVSDPVGLLRHSAEMLAPDGLAVVVTPDVRSIAARLLGKKWWHFRVAHVGYFHRHSLAAAASAAGLRVARRGRAKWFFRVSYLAERLAQYLPCRWLNRLAQRVRPFRWLYARTMPLNLFDSYVFLLQRNEPTSP